MSRVLRYALVLSVAAIAGLLFFPPSRGVGCGCLVVVEVRACLRSPTGEPVADRGVIGLLEGEEAYDPALTRTLAAWSEAARTGRCGTQLWDVFPQDGAAVHDEQFALTDSDGTLTLRLVLFSGYEFVSDEPFEVLEPKWRACLSALVVEGTDPAHPRVATTMPRGAWSERSTPDRMDEPTFVWNLGDVVVPD